MGFGSHALDRSFALQCWLQWLSLFMKLRFRLNPPCEPENIFLTLFARSAQWTGGYAFLLVALLLTGSFMIQLIMCAAMRDLPMHTTDDVGYAKNLNPF